jgi:hypothetical protein
MIGSIIYRGGYHGVWGVSRRVDHDQWHNRVFPGNAADPNAVIAGSGGGSGNCSAVSRVYAIVIDIVAAVDKVFAWNNIRQVWMLGVNAGIKHRNNYTRRACRDIPGSRSSYPGKMPLAWIAGVVGC